MSNKTPSIFICITDIHISQPKLTVLLSKCFCWRSLARTLSSSLPWILRLLRVYCDSLPKPPILMNFSIFSFCKGKFSLYKPVATNVFESMDLYRTSEAVLCFLCAFQKSLWSTPQLWWAARRNQQVSILPRPKALLLYKWKQLCIYIFSYFWTHVLRCGIKFNAGWVQMFEVKRSVTENFHCPQHWHGFLHLLLMWLADRDD